MTFIFECLNHLNLWFWQHAPSTRRWCECSSDPSWSIPESLSKSLSLIFKWIEIRAYKHDLEQGADRGVDCKLVDILLKLHDLHWSSSSLWQWPLPSLTWLSWSSPHLDHIWKPETMLDLWRGWVLEDADLERQLEQTSWAHLKDCDVFPLFQVRWCLRWEHLESTDAWAQCALTFLKCLTLMPLSFLLKNRSWLWSWHRWKNRWFEFLNEVLDRKWLDCSLSHSIELGFGWWWWDTEAWASACWRNIDSLTDYIVINEPLVDLLDFWHPAQPESE